MDWPIYTCSDSYTRFVKHLEDTHHHERYTGSVNKFIMTSDQGVNSHRVVDLMSTVTLHTVGSPPDGSKDDIKESKDISDNTNTIDDITPIEVEEKATSNAKNMVDSCNRRRVSVRVAKLALAGGARRTMTAAARTSKAGCGSCDRCRREPCRVCLSCQRGRMCRFKTCQKIGQVATSSKATPPPPPPVELVCATRTSAMTTMPDDGSVFCRVCNLKIPSVIDHLHRKLTNWSISWSKVLI